jgi:hypothetical protein
MCYENKGVRATDIAVLVVTGFSFSVFAAFTKKTNWNDDSTYVFCTIFDTQHHFPLHYEMDGLE